MNKAGSISLRKLFFSLIGGLSAILAACDKPMPNVQLLATDLHLAIGGNRVTLPFVALGDYAYRGMSFSLDPEGDRERERGAVEDLIRNAGDRDNPTAVRYLSVVVRTYGWNDSDMRQRDMCPLLTRAWARSVCDNPWAAIQQALPANSFTLVDLNQLSEKNAGALFNCVKESEPRLSIPKASGEPTIVCRASVYSDHVFHRAVVRIDGQLGALWTVWGHGQNGESADTMAHREGEAIVSFVGNALGASENFPKLHSDMCRLRRPGSIHNPRGADCGGEKGGLD